MILGALEAQTLFQQASASASRHRRAGAGVGRAIVLAGRWKLVTRARRGCVLSLAMPQRNRS
jgi:hypothetical protein